jgi:uncharacterized protein YajQ (UPF0234 family)
MPKEHSFDITAKFDTQEFKNAIDQAKKEVSTRYDFKGITTEINYDEKGKTLTLVSSSDSKIDALIDILYSKMIKRGLDVKNISEQKREGASGGNVRVIFKIVDTISQDEAKKIVKAIKGLKLKVQASIRGDVVRVTGKSIDDLQTCMKGVKELGLDIPLNFENLK